MECTSVAPVTYLHSAKGTTPHHTPSPYWEKWKDESGKMIAGR